MHYRAYSLIYLLIWALVSGCNGGGAAGPPPPTTVPLPSATTANQPASTVAVRVGVFPDSPPFEFMKSGALVGFDIDLMNAIAREAGLQVEFVQTRNWGGIFRDLAEGKFDAVISAATITDERKQLVAFSDPYFNAGQVVVVKEGSAIADPADLSSRKVGVLAGTTGEAWLAANATAEAVPYDNTPALFEAVIYGDVEAVIYDIATALQYIKDNPGSGLRQLDPVLTDELYAIAVRRDHPELLTAINQGLAAIRASGEYDQIYTLWFAGIPPSLPPPSTPPTDSRDCATAAGQCAADPGECHS